MNFFITFGLTTIYLIVLSWYDCKERRLPDFLTLGGAVVFLLCRLFFSGVDSFLVGSAGGLIGGLFLLVPFLLRGAGGGDVKMLFAVGCLLGVASTINALFFISVAGVCLAALMIVTRKVETARMKHLFHSAFDWRYDRAVGRAALPSKQSEKVRIPFGVAIAVGTWFTIVWELCRK